MIENREFDSRPVHCRVQRVAQVNSAFHPSGVGKSSPAYWLGLRRGSFACVGWQVTLCDPIWQVAQGRVSRRGLYSALTLDRYAGVDVCVCAQYCEQDPRCHRLLLTDLLIAPMQLCTKVPLLLNNILQHTVDPHDKLHLSACLEALEKSLSK